MYEHASPPLRLSAPPLPDSIATTHLTVTELEPLPPTPNSATKTERTLVGYPKLRMDPTLESREAPPFCFHSRCLPKKYPTHAQSESTAPQVTIHPVICQYAPSKAQNLDQFHASQRGYR
ncbi:hypothetical protein NLG97_g4096 [Lecanicillium saksenae]|uniref:Uncharacterized protein n=1 Tax=Lecanicillium saksenae TaxID=468837 RepID=A0ACC1QY43_9HYPO|nr:hypothetical protein NLG97_g4096 [Lecanicillium saksenae]